MPLLLSNQHCIYISYNDFIIVFNSRTNDSKILNSIECSQKIANIVSICLSKDSLLFSVCDDEKCLLVFNTTNWKITNKITVNKRVTSMIFTKKNNILLADKSGDVYEYSTDGNLLQFLMGHVSMLLHLTLCENDTFLATCDRDEKIRISHYPNCFEIQEYCLFHTDFVSQVVYLEKYDLLISGSGDGHIVLWDYINGKNLASIDCLQYLPNIKELASKVCQSSVHLNGEEFNGGDMESQKLNKEERDEFKSENIDGVLNRCRGCDIKKIVHIPEINIVAVTFERWNCILFFLIEENKLGFIHQLQTKGDILDLSVSNNQLYVLQNSEIEVFNAFSLFKDGSNNLLITSSDQELISSINKHKELFQNSRQIESIFPSLHKVHIDNISEYVERKRKRIMDNSKKKLWAN